MANYLREFATESAYTAATLVRPSVSLIDENNNVHFDPILPPVPKWIATYSDSSVVTAECDSTSVINAGDITKENLVSVEVGDCVTTLGSGAFYNCTSLTSVTIPSSVTSIGEVCCYNSSNLTSVTCFATTPPSLEGTGGWFGWWDSYPIYVPATSVDTYKAATNWSQYADRLQAIS